MMHYKATATREGKWWMVTIPDLDGLTQARRLSEAQTMAREWIAVTLDVPLEEVDVTVYVSHVADIEVEGSVIQIKEWRASAADAEARALEQAERLAKDLAAKGVPVRDIGTILDLSFQRAHQLVTKN